MSKQNRLGALLLCIGLIAEPTCLSAQSVTGDVALFRLTVGDRDGYIDATGKLAITPKFFFAGDFSEGLAPVMISRDIWGVSDARGIVTPIPPITQLEGFHYGLASARDGAGKAGYIDRTFRFVIPAGYSWASAFSGKAAIVELPWSQSNSIERYVVIDRNGNPVSDKRYEGAGEFTEGLAPVMSGGLWGFVDEHGAEAIPVKYKTVGPFSEGLAAVKVQTGGRTKCGFINPAGKMVIQPLFDDALPFSEGLAAASIDGKYGLIDRAGKWKVQPRYEYLRSPHDSIMLFRKNGKSGFIRLDETMVHDAIFDEAGDFHSGLAGVTKYQFRDGTATDLDGYLKKDGSVIWGYELSTQDSK
jgi:hypothetical protein